MKTRKTTAMLGASIAYLFLVLPLGRVRAQSPAFLDSQDMPAVPTAPALPAAPAIPAMPSALAMPALPAMPAAPAVPAVPA